MADERIKDFVGEIALGEIQALLDTLFFGMDDTSFSDAKKILLKTLLKIDQVTDNSIDYQALSPKGFYNSQMSESVKGIGEFADDGEIAAKSGDTLLRAGKQTEMQTQWKKDWLEKISGRPNIYYADSLTSPRAIAWQVTFNVTVSANLNYIVSPSIPNGYRYAALAVSYAVEHNGDKNVGFVSIQYSGSIVYVDMLSSGYLKWRIDADGDELYIRCHTGAPGGQALVSAHVNAVIVPD